MTTRPRLTFALLGELGQALRHCPGDGVAPDAAPVKPMADEQNIDRTTWV